VCPNCGGPAGTTPFCLSCGRNLANQSRLPTRAAWVTKQPEKARAASASRRSGRLALAAVIVVVIVAGAVVTVILATRGDKSNITNPAVAYVRVPSGSMEPTLKIAARIGVGAALRAPRVGAIIVFHPPAGADPDDAVCGNPSQGTGHSQACDKPTPRESSQVFVKRVVAIPGDVISIVNGHVIRNGTQENDRSYTYACGTGPDCNFRTPIKIAHGEYFVLGDNRGESDDSRFWGPVRAAWILGTVVH